MIHASIAGLSAGIKPIIFLIKDISSVLASFTEDVSVLLVEAFEVVAVKGIADLLCEIIVEIEVVENRKSHAEGFLRLDEMTDVCSGVIAAGRTTAVFIDGTGVVEILFVQQIHLSVPCEEIAVTCVSRRHYAVEEVNAAMYSFENIAGSTYTHEVSGLVGGHVRFNSFDDAVHFFGFFTDS